MEFESYPKIPRLRRNIVVTEKIDGTNAQVAIAQVEDLPDVPHHDVAIIDGYAIFAGSRKRWVTPEDDNFGFARWVQGNADRLVQLGPGRHYGEWWGQGVQRGYDLDHKRFSLFNSGRWHDVEYGHGAGDTPAPPGVHVVPVLYKGPWSEDEINRALTELRMFGSIAAPGFDRPEGVVVFHTASRTLAKVTLEDDAHPTGE